MTEQTWNQLAGRAYREAQQAADFNQAANPKIEARRIDAYRQGFEAGWRNAIAAARKQEETGRP